MNHEQRRRAESALNAGAAVFLATGTFMAFVESLAQEGAAAFLGYVLTALGILVLFWVAYDLGTIIGGREGEKVDK